MQTKNPQELWKKYTNLPHDLQKVIIDKNTTDAISKISKNYNLSVGKRVRLDDSTGLVLLGILHPKDFISNLSEKLGVDKETAKKIAEDVNREIFQKVRISLRKLYGITDEAPPPPKVSEAEIKITENVPATPPSPKASEGTAKPPSIPKPPPTPPKIIIKENIEIPKEAPKEELKPLEIRPIKGGPLGESEISAKKQPEPEKISQPGEMGHDAGLIIMPHSPAEISPARNASRIDAGGSKIPPLPTPAGVGTPTPKAVGAKPPPGLPFLEKKAEKKLEGDPYRERI